MSAILTPLIQQYTELRQHCEALGKFGDSLAAMLKIARSVSQPNYEC